MNSKSSLADSINKSCNCKTLDVGALTLQLEKDELYKGFYQDLIKTRPNLFSSTMVFVSENDLKIMQDFIREVEKVIQSEAFQENILNEAPQLARQNKGPKGVFMGYDFHLGPDGPKVIEINTNAGGGLLNAELAQAQKDCCIDISFSKDEIEAKYVTMFKHEWQLQRSGRDLRSIAIVDINPPDQYLYPEFKLFKKLFENHGISCVIADPSEFEIRENKLYLGEREIDLVYNRITDFYLREKNVSILCEAFEKDLAVVTPNPFHHALYADKKNLTFLGDSSFLENCGVSSEVSLLIQRCIPRTELVKAEKADELWVRRKELFFKPVHGYGSKASYRGDKITRKVWEEILAGDYVAQEIVQPGNRVVDVDGKTIDLKLDIRAYVYEGEIQLLAARLYSGQTTNFRTAGGGFAPVFITP